jgi:hypothetical protein
MRSDIDTEHVLARLDSALGLIERYTPHYYRHLRRDFSQIIVQRYACRGAYLIAQRACLVELTFLANPSFSEAQIAATILHEAMHARLHKLGLFSAVTDRAREERFCRRAELKFGQIVPGGQIVVERAIASLEAADPEVAPVIDEALARRRVARADLDSLRIPRWLRNTLARVRGLDDESSDPASRRSLRAIR